MKLLIRNLARTTTEEDLRALFVVYGKVQSCTLVLDKKSGRSKGFGFVEMPRKVDAKKALKTLNDFELKGQKMAVNEAKQGRDRKSAGNQKRFSPGRRR